MDDNDDDDAYADSREPEILIAGNTKDDLDGDRVRDWEDDFLLFFADPPRFRLGLNRESIDFNNNGEPDNLEDDDKPNYRLDYDEGSFGYHTYFKVELPFAQGLSVIPGYLREAPYPRPRKCTRVLTVPSRMCPNRFRTSVRCCFAILFVGPAI